MAEDQENLDIEEPSEAETPADAKEIQDEQEADPSADAHGKEVQLQRDIVEGKERELEEAREYEMDAKREDREALRKELSSDVNAGAELNEGADTDLDEDNKVEEKEEKLFDRLAEVFKNKDGEYWNSERSFFENIGILAGKIPAAFGEIWEGIKSLFRGKKKSRKEKQEKVTESKDVLAGPLEAKYVRLFGASLMVNPGKNLEIDGEKIPEGGNEMYIKGGRPTAKMYENMKAEVEAGKFADVRAIAILAGGNDIGTGRPASHVTDYLDKMIDLLHSANPNMKIAFVELPPPAGYSTKIRQKDGSLKEVHWGTEQDQKAKAINEWIRKRTKSDASVYAVEIYDELEDTNKPGWIREDMNGDGLHLNSKGYDFLRSQLASTFEGMGEKKDS